MTIVNTEYACSIAENEPCLWSCLTPELVLRIASFAHPNDVASSWRLVNKDTLRCLGDQYRTLRLTACNERFSGGDALGDSDAGAPLATVAACQPWPARDFVRHWSSPDPWRALNLYQRHRLLCLAASSCDAASFDAAAERCGCLPDADVLAAAAAAGALHACRALLTRHCCSSGPRVSRAAAAAGRLQTLRWVEYHAAAGSAVGGSESERLHEVAMAACRAGHSHVLRWLTRHRSPEDIARLEYSCYRPSRGQRAELAAAAARGGHVALLGELLSGLAGRRGSVSSSHGAVAEAEAEGAEAEEAEQLKEEAGEGEVELDPAVWLAVLVGCELAVAASCLKAWTAGQQPVAVEPMAEPPAAVTAGSGEDRSKTQLRLQLRLPELEVTGKLVLGGGCWRRLLAAAAASGTPCWRLKVDWLLLERVQQHCWGRRPPPGAVGAASEAPQVAGAASSSAVILIDLSPAAGAAAGAATPPPTEELLLALLRWPDAPERLQYLAQRGVRFGPAAAAAACAARAGAAAALGWLLDSEPALGAAASPAEYHRSGSGSDAVPAAPMPAAWIRLDPVLAAAAEGGHIPVLQLLYARGARLRPRHAAAAAAAPHAGAAAAVRWIAELLAPRPPAAAASADGAAASRCGGGGGGGSAGGSSVWSGVFKAVAASGACELPLLRLLHERCGAAVDLAVVAAGGSVESVEWAVAVLQAAGAEVRLDAQATWAALCRGNTATVARLMGLGRGRQEGEDREAGRQEEEGEEEDKEKEPAAAAAAGVVLVDMPAAERIVDMLHANWRGNYDAFRWWLLHCCPTATLASMPKGPAVAVVAEGAPSPPAPPAQPPAPPAQPPAPLPAHAAEAGAIGAGPPEDGDQHACWEAALWANGDRMDAEVFAYCWWWAPGQRRVAPLLPAAVWHGVGAALAARQDYSGATWQQWRWLQAAAQAAAALRRQEERKKGVVHSRNQKRNDQENPNPKGEEGVGKEERTEEVKVVGEEGEEEGEKLGSRGCAWE